MSDMKKKWEIKEELQKLARKHASSEDLLKLLMDKGYDPHIVVECIKEMIHEQLGTDIGQPNDEKIKLTMLQMIGYGVTAEKMWKYLADFKVPEEKRLKLLKEVYADLKSGKVQPIVPRDETFPKRKYTDEEIMSNKIDDDDRIICTLCGTDCSQLKKTDRKCPSCDYHMIKIMRDTVMKQAGANKEQVIEGLLQSDIFTDEEKDMIR